MPSYASRLSAAELDDLVAYLASLRGATDETLAEDLQAIRRLNRRDLARVARRTFVAACVAQDGEWLTYSGLVSLAPVFAAAHRSRPTNVSRLRPLWVYQPPGTGSLEATPIVANGVMYVTSGPTNVVALDLKSGKPLWEWTRPIAASVLNLGFPRVNRGVAILDNTVYVGTLDGYLVALDAKAGIERWTVHVGDNPTGHAITAAPLAVDDKIIVGISGGEAGIRGFLDAYDAKTGKLLWRFWTVPSPGEPGSETWAGDSWVHGGGATWLTGSYDPALKLLYWGTGNPGPDWNGDSRKGDNLYTSSLVAIDVEPARRAGISSSRRTTCTTGTRTRFRCSWTPRSADGRDRWSSWRIATRSTTCSIARPASSCSARSTRSRRGRRDSTRRGGRS